MTCVCYRYLRTTEHTFTPPYTYWPTLRLWVWQDAAWYCREYTGCPTRYRTRHFFNNVTTGWRTAASCRNN